MENNVERVLQVFGVMNRGGAESMIMNLFRNIDRSKVVFDFIVHTDQEGYYDKEILKLGGRIYHFPKLSACQICKYKNEWRKFFIDHPVYRVVHGHMGSTASIYLKEAKKNGLFTIAHSHSAGFEKGLKGFLYKVLNYKTRFIADYFFGCSKAAGIARFGKKVVSSNKYRTFMNGIDIDLFEFDVESRDKIRKDLNIDKSAVVFGTIGRITEAKNPYFIYKLFSHIVSKNENTVCLWVGTGELEEIFKDKIELDNHDDRFIMTGVRNDIPKILSAIDCFVFPSLWEGLPVSVVEAQASGLPCAVSNSITDEVKITNLVKFIPLNDNVEFWEKECFALLENKGRNCPRNEIVAAGYDIKNTSLMLTEFYLKNCSRGRK